MASTKNNVVGRHYVRIAPDNAIIQRQLAEARAWVDGKPDELQGKSSSANQPEARGTDR